MRHPMAKSHATWFMPAMCAVAFVAVTAPMTGAARAETRWSGVYVGASAGWASSNTNVDLNAVGFGNLLSVDGIGSSGSALGLSIGADVQRDRYLVGVFGDWVRHDQSWSLSAPALVPGTLASIEIDSQWTVGARAGVIVGNSLLYGLAGYTRMQTSDLAVPPANTTLSLADFKGWSVGGGIETALGGGFFLAAEYRFTAFERQTAAVPLALASFDLDPEMHEAKARLSYKFGLDRSSPTAGTSMK